ncbi:hypothetical protein [Streptomyces sp. TLI_185]|uniref:hypothetical protein n=1 Tax=Streptomyces sp. TLI_185 TaxID=2485151 RepID=UPI000F4D67AD|nr:hypothetical protein [Streptomyces sp. TLI_185]
MLDRLPMGRAVYRIRPDGTELNRLDLMIDFVPVVHLAKTIPDGGEHWGRSVLARVLQALDEPAATDSDSSAASATTGTPIIGLAGARPQVDRATGRPQELQVRAGAVWKLALPHRGPHCQDRARPPTAVTSVKDLAARSVTECETEPLN